MVTKTKVHHLKPKKTKNKQKTCPHHSGYDTLDISLLIINYQHNHTLFSVKHMANTESQKTTESKQNIYLDNGKKKGLYKRLIEKPATGGVLLCLACEIRHSNPGAIIP